MVFVTHDINPVLEHVDRVLYLAGGRFRSARPTRCCAPRCSASCTDPGRRVRTRGRIVVVGAPDESHAHDHGHSHDHPHPDEVRGGGAVNDWWTQLFDFADYGALLVLLQNSIIAGAVLGLVGGLIGVFVMPRDMAFAVHGISELSFAGAAARCCSARRGRGSIVGSLVAAVLIGLLGTRARDRNSIIGVLMPFGLGLGILFLALYPGRARTGSGC